MKRRIAVLLPLLLLADEAFARVGGGQDFGGGGGGSSGGSFGGGSGGGGGGGDLVWFLIWLLLHHPVIGVPAVLIALFLFFRLRTQSSEPTRYRAPAPPRQTSDLAALRSADPAFSRPLFIDFAQLVYARGLTLRGQRPLLRPYFSAEALDALEAGGAGVARDLIFGATRVERVALGPTWTTLAVQFEVNYTEVRGDTPTQMLAAERWTFRRRAGVTSPGPEPMRSLGCPSCGATAEPRANGTCPNCDAVRTGGALQWEVSEIRTLTRRTLEGLELHLGGGVEPGTRNPTILAPDLMVARRAFETLHPDHDWSAFKQHAITSFRSLQEAWSSGRWEQARPFETDALFQVHRFWMDRFAAAGLRNRGADVTVSAVQLASVEVDAYYESLTVRIFASMRDWTEDGGGTVVSGSKVDPRVFTEYWTFLRSTKKKPSKAGEGKAEGARCPSCGAPLDRVSAAGVCGYCDAKITTGEFGWVLSRIEQDDVYAG